MDFIKGRGARPSSVSWFTLVGLVDPVRQSRLWSPGMIGCRHLYLPCWDLVAFGVSSGSSWTTIVTIVWCWESGWNSLPLIGFISCLFGTSHAVKVIKTWKYEFTHKNVPSVLENMSTWGYLQVSSWVRGPFSFSWFSYSFVVLPGRNSLGYPSHVTMYRLTRSDV